MSSGMPRGRPALIVDELPRGAGGVGKSVGIDGHIKQLGLAMGQSSRERLPCNV